MLQLDKEIIVVQEIVITRNINEIFIRVQLQCKIVCYTHNSYIYEFELILLPGRGKNVNMECKDHLFIYELFLIVNQHSK